MYAVLPRILCVDDEPHVLEGMVRNLRRQFDVTVAHGGEEGLDRVEREGPFAVVLSDQRMPGMDGVTFLSRVRTTAPDTVRILLTGYADTTAAMGAVNRGAVFRFLGKPIETVELLQTLNLAVEQHRVITAERVLLERTLHGSIKAITDVLALINPSGFGRALRAKEIVASLAAATRTPDAWQVEIAAMISQIGSMAMNSVPAQSAPANLAQVESSAATRLSKIAADMVANIPRMEEVHAILTHQDLRFDGSNGGAGSPRQHAIPLGARMLKIAFDLDTLEVEQRMPRGAAVEMMRTRWGCYDPELLEALLGAPALQAGADLPLQTGAAPPAMTELELRRLEPGMRLAEEVRTPAGRVLISRDEVATADSIDRIKRTLGFNELRQIVRVMKLEPAGARPLQPGTSPMPRQEPAFLAPSSPSSVDCGEMRLDLTMRLTI